MLAHWRAQAHRGFQPSNQQNPHRRDREHRVHEATMDYQGNVYTLLEKELEKETYISILHLCQTVPFRISMWRQVAYINCSSPLSFYIVSFF